MKFEVDILLTALLLCVCTSCTNDVGFKNVAKEKNPLITEEESALAGKIDKDLVPAKIPGGFGQLESPLVIFKAGKDKDGREYFLNGQLETNGKLIFTASNGFFDKGVCRAYGTSKLPKKFDEKLIRQNFEYLGRWMATEKTIRWHVWMAQPGKVRFNINLEVPEKTAGSTLKINFAGQERIVKTVYSNPSDKSQPWDLLFDVPKAGEYKFSMELIKLIGPKSAGVGKLYTVDMYGPAVTGAKVLRARWRPAAVYSRYFCTKIEKSTSWIMVSRSTEPFGNYAPITTPFGYYGTGFGPDRRSSEKMNFSMWATGRTGKTPPLYKMPVLLAAGSPDALFSGFGHEGSGVKIRGWHPLQDRPKDVVQYLRVEKKGDYNLFYGYFWEHSTHKWKLFCLGGTYNNGKPITDMKARSFCEVIGPPNTERAGDCKREIRRRGWYFADGKWWAMDKVTGNPKTPFNNYSYITEDGEFAMATGGMRYYKTDNPPPLKTEAPIPEFLSPKALKDLNVLPADFGKFTAKQLSPSSVEIDFTMIKVGPDAKAELYYGTKDCLTFVKSPFKLTDVDKEGNKIVANERIWQNYINIRQLQKGSNKVVLKGLKPDITYFYRVLITSDNGKCWAFNSEKFKLNKK